MGEMTCNFMVFPEFASFRNILPKQANYLRYIDNALLVHSRHTNIPDVVGKLKII